MALAASHCAAPVPAMLPVLPQESAKTVLDMAVVNDTLFLSLLKVVDYSILLGVDEENGRLVAGIIDYMRHYDLVKKIESGMKQVGMIAGQAAPTIVPPQLYKRRFRQAMDRYFMAVPSKYTAWAAEE